MSERCILHADLDAFFASVELLDDPSLQGQPIVVGGLGNRGVVATANYEARAYGVHSALPMALARRRCPNGVYRSPRMRRYEELSRSVMSILREVTPLVEQLSVDEAFFDISGSQRRAGTPSQIAQAVRTRVREECGLPVSIGGGPSKFIAKMATEDAKPNGVRIVERNEVQDFLDQHSIRAVPGIGPKTGEVLRRIGIETVRDARTADPNLLVAALGATRAAALADLALGRDDRAIQVERDRKSIGHEETFAADLIGAVETENHLFRILHEAVRRARVEHVVARTVQLKVRDSDFQTITRSSTVREATMDPADWWPVVQSVWAKVPSTMKRIRLLGISFSQLVTHEPTLFTPAGEPAIVSADGERKRTDIPDVVDAVRERFGANAIGVARLVRHKPPNPDGKYGPTG